MEIRDGVEKGMKCEAAVRTSIMVGGSFVWGRGGRAVMGLIKKIWLFLLFQFSIGACYDISNCFIYYLNHPCGGAIDYVYLYRWAELVHCHYWFKAYSRPNS